MIKVLSFTPTEYFGSNCFLINSDGEYAVVDPSVEYKMIEAQHPEIKGNVKYILLTHCHFDHILYTESWVAACPNALVVVGENDGPALANPMMNCFLGFLGIYDGYNGKYTPVSEGRALPFGSSVIKVIDCPGHTPGGVSYRIGEHLFVGDTLFAGGGYGRCDLPGGDFSALEKTIIKIITREPDSQVYCGHGESTTLSEIIKNLM